MELSEGLWELNNGEVVYLVRDKFDFAAVPYDKRLWHPNGARYLEDIKHPTSVKRKRQMEKKDLKNGMLMVFIKNNTKIEHRALVMDNELLFVMGSRGSLDKTCLSNDCKNLWDTYTLVKIMQPNTPSTGNIGIDFDKFVQNDRYWKTIYEVEEPVEEMTLEQVCKALGKTVKIVKG